MTGRLHDDELRTDTATVRALLQAHDPTWSALPLRPLDASGSSNALHRLGDGLLVRLPRQPGGSATIRKEARWAGRLARELPVAVALADDVRTALAASAPIVGDRVDLAAAREVWEEALALPGAAEAVAPEDERWLHADLLAENLLVRGGRLAGLLGLGGLAVGDPTVDLVVAWEVLDAEGRAAFRDAVGVDESTWLRGRGWALAIAAITFPYYATTMPARCADRLVMLRAVLDDARGRRQAAGS